MAELHTFEITMRELQRDGFSVRTLRQTARVETRQQVIELYGLDEPDILSYTIEQLD